MTGYKQKSNPAAARGFTMMEMMTAVALLIMVIVAVGIIFRSTGNTVGLSQATSEMLSNVRATQQQIEADVNNIDRNGFLVIRARLDGSGRRYDQFSFLANGPYPNHTGSMAVNPFSDNTVANSAHVWYGQAIKEPEDGTADQTVLAGLGSPPTGVFDKDFIFARHVFLLLAPSGTSANQITNGTYTVAAYTSIAYSGASNVSPGNGEPAASITSSRLCTVAQTNSALMAQVMTTVLGSGRGGNTRYEADNYCYRFKVMPNVYATDAGIGTNSAFANSYFRMHPIMVQGMPSFAVEWTDGGTFAGSDIDPVTGTTVASSLVGTTRWFGPGNPKYGSPGTDQTEPTLGSYNDSYTAVFSFDNKPKWPKALRIRFRVTDPSDRMQGGRDFVQAIKLPG